MSRSIVHLLSISLAVLTISSCKSKSSSSDSQAAQPAAAGVKTIRIGAASSPKYGAVFDAMKRDFERAGQPFEFTLYMDYFKLVDALLRREVDIAWNTPMAHARAYLLTGGKVLGPVARDVDIQYAVQLIVRKDSGIDSIQDLPGKKIALGSIESAELQALPKLYLKREGLDIDAQMTVLNLNGIVDDQMNALSTATHVINAVTNGDADVGAVGEKTTRAIRSDPNSLLKVIWTSPRYTHCIMTTLDDYDPKLIEAFKNVLLSEHMNDPIGKEVLVNEGNDAVWMDSSSDRDTLRGFDDLLAAIGEQNLPIREQFPAPGFTKITVGGISSTKALLTFEAMKRYFQREGEAQFEFVLYGTSDQLADALFSRRIEVAWNTPLDHARAFIRASDQVLAPAIRHSDMDYHFHVVVLKNAGILTLSDIEGKRLVLGSEKLAELSILPRRYLPQAGLDLARVTLVSLDGRIDAERKPVDLDGSVADAVITGEGDAGVVGDAMAAAIQADAASPLQVIWTSQGFGYQTMTALADFDQATLNRFSSVLMSMTSTDPTGKVVLESASGANWWVAGSNDLYGDLIEAVKK